MDTKIKYVFLLIFIYIILAFSSVYRKSLTYDEPSHLKFGAKAITGNINNADMQRTPITALNVLPVFLAEKAGLKLQGQTRLLLQRIPTILISAILAYFVFMWSKKLYGINAGLFSLLLYIFCPNITAHGSLATTDLYCTFFMFMGVYYFVKYAEISTIQNLVLLSFFTGIALISKQTAFLLFPIYLSLYLIRKITNKNNNTIGISIKMLHLAIFFIVIIFLINISYAFNQTFKPLIYYLNNFQNELKAIVKSSILNFCLHCASFIIIPFPKAFVESFILGGFYNVTGQGHGLIYLLGNLSRSGWWYYFPVVFLIKTPLAVLIFIIIRLYILIRNIKESTFEEISLLTASAIIFIFFCFFCTAQVGIRYILPVFPFIYVFLGKLAVFRPKKYINVYKNSIRLLMFWLILSSLSFYPHYISYFNESIGNRMNMYKWLADSNVDWGQNQYYIDKYLREHENTKISVNPTGQVSGIVIIEINKLIGIFESAETYRWLKEHYKPVEHIAYSCLVYNIPEDNKNIHGNQ